MSDGGSSGATPNNNSSKARPFWKGSGWKSSSGVRGPSGMGGGVPGSVRQVRGAQYPPPVPLDDAEPGSPGGGGGGGGNNNGPGRHSVGTSAPSAAFERTEGSDAFRSVPGAQGLHGAGGHASGHSPKTPGRHSLGGHGAAGAGTPTTRMSKFEALLAADICDIPALRRLSWFGVPKGLRPDVWRVLLGYAPGARARREETLGRRRAEYALLASKHYRQLTDAERAADAAKERTDEEGKLRHQVEIDVLRTCPESRLFQRTEIREALNRLLYVWAIRHPASGYVQGINDLATPFVMVFLAGELEKARDFGGGIGGGGNGGCGDASAERDAPAGCDGRSGDEQPKYGIDPDTPLDPEVMARVEADTFWSLSKLIDGIQDHYTFAQPGIQRMVFRLHELTAKVDAALVAHLEEQGIEFLQFSFRWFNCLLLRELTMQSVIRMWDTYLTEDNGFSEFHLYVCVAFLTKFSDVLKTLDFQEIVMFLQSPPTQAWTDTDIEMVISQAYMYASLFSQATSHLKS